MISTNSYIILPNEDQKYISDDGRVMLEGFKLTFNLSAEDYEIFTEYILPRLPHCDIADGLLGMITYGIHKSWEDITGRRFVLDMDRDKN